MTKEAVSTKRLVGMAFRAHVLGDEGNRDACLWAAAAAPYRAEDKSWPVLLQVHSLLEDTLREEANEAHLQDVLPELSWWDEACMIALESSGYERAAMTVALHRLVRDAESERLAGAKALSDSLANVPISGGLAPMVYGTADLLSAEVFERALAGVLLVSHYTERLDDLADFETW